MSRDWTQEETLEGVMQTDLGIYLELRKAVIQEVDAQKGNDFIRFLNYCAACLDKGDSVQAIWNDFQVKTLRVF